MAVTGAGTEFGSDFAAADAFASPGALSTNPLLGTVNAARESRLKEQSK